MLKLHRQSSASHRMCGTTKAKKSCLFIFLIPHRGTCSALFTIRVAKLWEFWKLSMENTEEFMWNCGTQMKTSHMSWKLMFVRDTAFKFQNNSLEYFQNSRVCNPIQNVHLVWFALSAIWYQCSSSMSEWFNPANIYFSDDMQKCNMLTLAVTA